MSSSELPSPDDHTLSALLARIAAGEETALEQLVLDHSQLIDLKLRHTAFTRGLKLDESVRDSLFNIVLEKIWNGAALWRPDPHRTKQMAEAWVKRIAHNTVVDEIRSRLNKKNLIMESALSADAASLADMVCPQAFLGDPVKRELFQKFFARALTVLSGLPRDVFVADMEAGGRESAEPLADEHGITPDKIHAARRHYRRALEKDLIINKLFEQLFGEGMGGGESTHD